MDGGGMEFRSMEVESAQLVERQGTQNWRAVEVVSKVKAIKYP